MQRIRRVLGALLDTLLSPFRSPLSQAVIDQALFQGSAPELIYVLTLRGYRLNEQSAGVINDEGFGAYYFSRDGKHVQFRGDRGSFSDELCSLRPVTDSSAPVQWERDEVGWYRAGGEQHEYVVVRNDVILVLAGKVAEVPRATLREAIAGARHLTVTGHAEPGSAPAKRGDLPRTGDGAPNNTVGPGG